MLFIAATFFWGVACLWSGWSGWTDGHITGHRKLQDSYVAYASGPYQAEFELAVHLRMWGGGLLALLGVALAAVLLLGSPERRDRMLEAASRLSAHQQSRLRIPAWLLGSVLGVFIAVLVYAAIGI